MKTRRGLLIVLRDPRTEALQSLRPRGKLLDAEAWLQQRDYFRTRGLLTRLAYILFARASQSSCSPLLRRLRCATPSGMALSSFDVPAVGTFHLGEPVPGAANKHANRKEYVPQTPSGCKQCLKKAREISNTIVRAPLCTCWFPQVLFHPPRAVIGTKEYVPKTPSGCEK